MFDEIRTRESCLHEKHATIHSWINDNRNHRPSAWSSILQLDLYIPFVTFIAILYSKQAGPASL